MSLLGHLVGTITKPKNQWEAIKAEQTSVAGIFTGYIMILALIPAAASFISMSVIGVNVLGFSWKFPIAYGIVQAVSAYLISLVSIYVSAFIFNALANSFGSTADIISALKLVAFSMTTYWVLSIFQIYYALAWIAYIGGIYGLYVMFTGLTPLMNTPPDKKVGYFVVSIVIIVVVMVVVGLIFGIISALIMPNPFLSSFKF